MTAASTPAEAPLSVWIDCLEIFYAPTQVFERRREDPVVFLPLVILSLALGGIFIGARNAMMPIMDAEFSRGFAAAMKANPQLTPEMAQQSRAVMEKWSVLGILILPLFPLLTGFTLWLVGKLVESKQELSAALMVGVYSFFPKILEGLCNALQALALPDERLNSIHHLKVGVSRFLDPDATSQLLLAVVGRIDIFTLWVTALLAIGLSVTGKIPRANAWLAAAMVWVLGALPQVWGAIRAGG